MSDPGIMSPEEDADAYEEEVRRRRDLECVVRLARGEAFAVLEDGMDDFLSDGGFAGWISPAGSVCFPFWAAALATAGLRREERELRVLFDLKQETLGPFGLPSAPDYLPALPFWTSVVERRTKGPARSERVWPPKHLPIAQNIHARIERDYSPGDRALLWKLRRIAARTGDPEFVASMQAAVNLAGGSFAALCAILDRFGDGNADGAP